VKIDIPSVLVRLRGRIVREQSSRLSPERLAMRAVAAVFASPRRYEAAQRLARLGRGPLTRVQVGPLGRWTAMRDLPEPPVQSFREWWRSRG
jgi:L-lactate dehydrogenase complex protein LldF